MIHDIAEKINAQNVVSHSMFFNYTHNDTTWALNPHRKYM